MINIIVSTINNHFNSFIHQEIYILDCPNFIIIFIFNSNSFISKNHPPKNAFLPYSFSKEPFKAITKNPFKNLMILQILLLIHNLLYLLT
jgi:hypothetical protein